MKKILIFSMRGGRGHVSVSDALSHHLEQSYEVHTSFVFQDALASIDLFARFFGERYSLEALYNFCIQHKLSFLVNFLYAGGFLYFFFYRKQIVEKLMNYCQTIKPDCIISVIPLMNGEILSVAQNYNIPFLLLPTDLDITLFLKGIKRLTHQKFRLCLMLDHPTIRGNLQKKRMLNTAVVHTGVVLRKDFFELKDTDVLRKRYSIPIDKPVVLVVMGGMGSTKLVSLASFLGTIDYPMHLVLCIGNKRSLRQQIEQLCFPEHITYTIQEFTERMSDLMALSSLIITKSGTISVCEALYLKKPLILDGMGTVLQWEKFNHRFVETIGAGYSCKTYSELRYYITLLLTKGDTRKSASTEASVDFYKNGSATIKTVVDELLAYPTVSQSNS